MSFALLCASLTRTLSCSFQSVTQRTAKKFLQFKHPTAKKFFPFYHAATKKFLWFPGLKLKRPATSRKKNFFLRTQKEVLARALFLGCTVVGHEDGEDDDEYRSVTATKKEEGRRQRHEFMVTKIVQCRNTCKRGPASG